jgi:hypothetical protein
MSHYATIAVKIKDRDCLIRTLQEEFGENNVEIHTKPQNLIGYGGEIRGEVATIIVRRTHIGTLSNDLGFNKRPDGTYEMLVSDHDIRANGNRIQKLMTNYAARLIVKKYPTKYHIQSKVNGKIVLASRN